MLCGLITLCCTAVVVIEPLRVINVFTERRCYHSFNFPRQLKEKEGANDAGSRHLGLKLSLLDLNAIKEEFLSHSADRLQLRGHFANTLLTWQKLLKSLHLYNRIVARHLVTDFISVS